MKRILFCVLLAPFLGSCKSGLLSGGAWGGLSNDQVQAFTALQTGWSDARSAYTGAVTHAIPATTRAKAMAQALANSAACVPSQDGNPNPPLNSNFSNDIGLSGSTCAVNAIEHEGYSYSTSEATYIINHSYVVNANPNGTAYLGINPLQSFSMLSGSLQMTMLNGVLSTAGNFSINFQMGNQQYNGQITALNNQVQMVMNFPTFQMTAQATWTPGVPGATYVIQGEQVTSTEFASALSDFHMIDIVNVAQNAPLYLH